MTWIFLFVALFSHAAPKQYGRYFISGQPTEKELADFKKKTGAAVVDLRDFDELGNCSEPATVSKLGMQYERVMFQKTGKIDPSVIANIEGQVAQTKDKPVLIFCKTGNRSSAWLAIHLVEKEKMAVEEALKIARTTGLKPDMEPQVREYLSTPH